MQWPHTTSLPRCSHQGARHGSGDGSQAPASCRHSEPPAFVKLRAIRCSWVTHWCSRHTRAGRQCQLASREAPLSTRKGTARMLSHLSPRPRRCSRPLLGARRCLGARRSFQRVEIDDAVLLVVLLGRHELHDDAILCEDTHRGSPSFSQPFCSAFLSLFIALTALVAQHSLFFTLSECAREHTASLSARSHSRRSRECLLSSKALFAHDAHPDSSLL